ncbi:uncharacterized protein LOC135210207 isoform X2 [Macrobrachium nipponense]|uniref:uncharacterized protein LOC135210207 isoform X2 n=1 Tax=Macrobrachium nipponense TaxID=159736 RepID=UPI0030C8D244
MDPHMTREDLENLYLEPLTHRHLKQSHSPLANPPTKKKKLVNFKLSLRRDSVDDHTPIKYNQIASSRKQNAAPEGREDPRSTTFKNLNMINKRDESVSSLSTQESILTPEANGNVPGWTQIDDNQRPKLNQITSPTKSVLKNKQPPGESVPLQTRRKSVADQWNMVRSLSREDSVRRTSLYSVVNVVFNKRKGTPAPSIWTPSVPRSQPAPRPGNWREQEEPGKGHFMISFVSNVALQKTKQQIRQMKFQVSPYYQESQSPRQRRRHVEFYGKHYVQWMSDILKNQAFQSGTLMKGLEIGIQFPVVHLTPVSTNANSKRHQDASSSSTTSLGLASDAVMNQGIYEEVVSWIPELLVTCPSDPSEWARCFIVIAFKTLDGDFSRVEEQWREWTGALHVYFNISDDLHLKKLSFYRRSSRHHPTLFTYIVIIEVDTVTKENCLYLLDFVYRMRMKGMGGYLGVYQEHVPSDAPTSASSSSSSSSSSSASSTTNRKDGRNLSGSSTHSLDSSALDLTKINI